MEVGHFIRFASDFLITIVIFDLFSIGEYLLPLAKPILVSGSVFVITGLILDLFCFDLSELKSVNVLHWPNSNSFLDLYLSGGTTFESRMCLALFVAVALSILDRISYARHNFWWLIIWSVSIAVWTMIRLSWHYFGKADFISFAVELGAKLAILLWRPALHWVRFIIIALLFIYAFIYLTVGFTELAWVAMILGQGRFSSPEMYEKSRIFTMLNIIFNRLPKSYFLSIANSSSGIIFGTVVINYLLNLRWSAILWQYLSMKYVRNDYALKLIGYDRAMKGQQVMEM